MNERPEGLEVPLHRSLVEPMLLAGLPRTVALVLWTSVGAFSFGLHQIWTLPVGIALHLAAAAAGWGQVARGYALERKRCASTNRPQPEPRRRRALFRRALAAMSSESSELARSGPRNASVR